MLSKCLNYGTLVFIAEKYISLRFICRRLKIECDRFPICRRMCGIHLPALVPSLLCPLDDQHDDDNDDGDHRDGNNVGGDGATHIHILIWL